MREEVSVRKKERLLSHGQISTIRQLFVPRFHGSEMSEAEVGGGGIMDIKTRVAPNPDGGSRTSYVLAKA
jgi:hypothetical protein